MEIAQSSAVSGGMWQKHKGEESRGRRTLDVTVNLTNRQRLNQSSQGILGNGSRGDLKVLSFLFFWYAEPAQVRKTEQKETNKVTTKTRGEECKSRSKDEKRMNVVKKRQQDCSWQRRVRKSISETIDLFKPCLVWKWKDTEQIGFRQSSLLHFTSKNTMVTFLCCGNVASAFWHSFTPELVEVPICFRIGHLVSCQVWTNSIDVTAKGLSDFYSLQVDVEGSLTGGQWENCDNNNHIGNT